MTRETQSLPTAFGGSKNALALLSVISFSLSAVMSTPQVVKGLAGAEKLDQMIAAYVS